MMYSSAEKVRRYVKPSQWRRLWNAFLGPRVVLASVPKSGTNLLLRILQLLPHLRSAGTAVGAPDELPEVLPLIAQIKPGQFITTHYAFTDISEIVDRLQIRGLFVIRDPRDTCVSWCHYIMKESAHWCHEYFHDQLADPATRLMKCITGMEGDPGNGQPYLSSIDEHFRRRLDYLQESRFLTVRFEDAIGSAGGGIDERQRAVIVSLAHHLGLRLNDRDIHRVVVNAYDSTSPTFRRGQIGSWQEEMQSEHRARFKEIAGPLLVELGYEKDMDW